MVRIAIIGGVAAGMSAAAQARRRDPRAEIVVFEKGPVVSYAMCVLPYYISDEIKDEQSLIIYDAEYFRKKRNIDVRLKHEVVEVDTRDRYLVVKDLDIGEVYEYDYDKLIISTGAHAIVMDFLKGYGNVQELHDYQSAIKLKRLINARLSAGKRRVVVIGSGNVGLEVAESLVIRGFEVTVIEKEEQILPYLDRPYAEIIKDYLISKGIRIVNEEEVIGVEAALGEVTAVKTDKNVYPADIVVPAIGVKANVEIIKNSGIAIGNTGAIKVDQRQQTNINGIFACGDCCEKYSIARNRFVYLPLGTYANKEGIIAGDNATGTFRRNRGITETIVTKLFDLEFGKTGLTETDARGFKQVEILEADLPLYPREISKSKIKIKLVLEKGSERILGAEMIGEAGVASRLDVISTAIINNMTVKDLADVDFSYMPRLKPVRDPLLNLVLRKF